MYIEDKIIRKWNKLPISDSTQIQAKVQKAFFDRALSNQIYYVANYGDLASVTVDNVVGVVAVKERVGKGPV